MLANGYERFKFESTRYSHVLITLVLLKKENQAISFFLPGYFFQKFSTNFWSREKSVLIIANKNFIAN